MTQGNPLVYERSMHGIGVMNIENQEKLVVFGGTNYSKKEMDSIEIFDEKTEKWYLADFKLNEPRADFGFMTY